MRLRRVTAGIAGVMLALLTAAAASAADWPAY